MNTQFARVWRCASFLILIALMAGNAWAQAPSPLVVKVGDIEGEEISANELDTLERMIASYVVEMESFRVVDSRGTELALSELEAAAQLSASGMKNSAILVPDYVLSGKIGKIGSVFVFSLDNTKVRSGEKRTVSGNFTSVNDIVLNARSLTRRIFNREEPILASYAQDGKADPTASGPLPSPGLAQVPQAESPLSLTLLVGTWTGDKGLHRVRLFKDGKGSATLSSGISMKVKASIVDGRFLIEQDQPNVAGFYSSPSYSKEVAKEISRKARPMRWVFQISTDRKTLKGIKESVAVQRSPGGELVVNNGYTREALWTKN